MSLKPLIDFKPFDLNIKQKEFDEMYTARLSNLKEPLSVEYGQLFGCMKFKSNLSIAYLQEIIEQFLLNIKETYNRMAIFDQQSEGYFSTHLTNKLPIRDLHFQKICPFQYEITILHENPPLQNASWTDDDDITEIPEHNMTDRLNASLQKELNVKMDIVIYQNKYFNENASIEPINETNSKYFICVTRKKGRRETSYTFMKLLQDNIAIKESTIIHTPIQ